MLAELTVTEARRQWFRLLDDAQAGIWSVISPATNVPLVVALLDEVLLLHGCPNVAPVALPHMVALRNQIPHTYTGVVHSRLLHLLGSVQASRARREFRALLVAASDGPLRVDREQQSYVIAPARSVARDLGEIWRFTPEVIFEPDGVSIWLPQLAIYGRGPDVEAAAADLLDEMRAYADEWQADLRFAPNHRDRVGWVRRIQLARSEEELAALLDDEPHAA